MGVVKSCSSCTQQPPRTLDTLDTFQHASAVRDGERAGTTALSDPRPPLTANPEARQGPLHQAAGASACRALQHGALQGQLRTEECSAGLKVKGLRPLLWEVRGAVPPGAPGVLDRGPSLKA